ncbi:DUF4159 domain-containing protein [Xinfangfangia sp. CPCC 101601]|uniref:DUF4159 domain-containing protein n=1 Tax=Pseudogemmobacter lacusdianii TaxID=3069608 RepID=A0ABU0VYR9_9RHOB|nr:DUF4159 domain-containing protein [Xinfangfangia sp. CPCC 101601]MDQ2066907.1 DUF4159 domain-containing protein [Xinfangfangia sp. CPCC 101601]
MFTLGPIGFLNPMLLAALIALPILWLLLRAVPPAPIRRRFPGVALLLGLKDEAAEADKTPWWLLLLRILAVAAAIIGFAGPVLHPEERQAGSGPLLVVLDGGWAEARDWARRMNRAEALVEEAGGAGRTVSVIRLTDRPSEVVFQSAEAWSGRLIGMEPAAWAPSDLEAWAAALPEGDFDTLWLADGLAHPGREALAQALRARGAVTVVESPRPVLALHPAGFRDGKVVLAISRIGGEGGMAVEIAARGPDPAGIDRELARVPVSFEGAATRAEVEMDLPPELRNRVTRFEIPGLRSAGAVSLTDDSLKRRKVAILGSGGDDEGLQLLSPTHYLRQALTPVADLVEGALSEVLVAKPDVIILADVARISGGDQAAMLEWLEAGGLLLRFAGPRMAASDVSRFEEDPLLPVRLREGGRTVGGAMSWGEPKALAPFPEGSPFFGLALPDDVAVKEQVLAQPDPSLAERTIAALDDGTPLVTRKVLGQGQVVLVHVTANAEWSSLPLSGLFVQMLERLAVSTRPAMPEASDLAGQIWVPEEVLDAWGAARNAGEIAGVEGTVLAQALKAGPNPDQPPGLYAGLDRRVALNVIGAETELKPAVWPAGVSVTALEEAAEQSLKGPLLGGALGLLLLDILAALFVAGRLSGWRRGAAALALAGLALGAAPERALAQDEPLPGDDFAIEATSAVVLAHVLTGDDALDEMAEAGLRGLGDRLWQRTSIEPAEPMGVDLEADELGFFPFLYWPVTAEAPTPSAAAYDKLNQFLRTGGMILFDTRDGDVAGFGGATPEGEALQRIALGLDIPALEQIPQDHVLTRTFYLLQEFPGRWQEGALWVEAAPADAALEEGMPFRNLNDGVTPVVIGGNDWASAWATDAAGVPMLPVGRGFTGERQREIAYRFGINLIMHVLTGNYKSDQVHVPALLERLGQ